MKFRRRGHSAAAFLFIYGGRQMSPNEIDAAALGHIGELRAGIRALADSQRRIEDAMRRSEDKSDESRAKVHSRMDELVDRVATVEGDVKSVNDDVLDVKKLVNSDIKPVTDKVKRWELIGIGALSMAGVAGTALGVAFADVVKRFLLVVLGRA